MHVVSNTKQDGVGFAIGGGSGDISHGEGLGVGCDCCDQCESCEQCGRTSCTHGGGSGG